MFLRGGAIKEKGSPYAKINNSNGRFFFRKLRIVFYGIKCKCMAHDRNPKMTRTDLIEAKGADGKYILNKRVESASRERLTVKNSGNCKPLN